MPVGDLRVGMRVMELDRPWEGTPFLFQGFVIESEDELELVRELCGHVYIDIESTVEYTNAPHKTGPIKGGASITRIEKKAPVERELYTAHRTYTESSRLTKNILDDVRLGRVIDTPAAKSAVESCVESILRSPDALLLLTNLRNKDAYTAEHSLNVSILTMALGRHMGLERDKLVEIGMCALLHDIGKVLIPDEILNKDGRYTDEEYDIMKRHTVFGRDLLMSSSGMPLASLDVAHGHHEAIDGSGYPRGITGSSMSEWTKAVAITDAFDAITSDRVYKEGRTSLDALRILNGYRGKRYDADLVTKFVRAVGIFPPGSVVELNNGFVCVVVESNQEQRLRPRVLVVRFHGQDLDDPRPLDLAQVGTDKKKRPLQISKMLRPEKAGVDLHALRERGILHTPPTGVASPV
jgi:HD-GYP domain-containing protein (c-di-GMP phosphodiesterase class II)